MARRSRIFPLSIQSFLFVFLVSHLFSRDSACPFRITASMDFSRHGLGAEQTARVPCCVDHIAGNIKQLASAGLRSEAVLTHFYMVRRGSMCPAVFPVSDPQKNSAKLTLTSATHASTQTMKTSAADTQEVSEKLCSTSSSHMPRRHGITITRLVGPKFLQKVCLRRGRTVSLAGLLRARCADPITPSTLGSHQTAAIQAVADRYRFVHDVIIMTVHSTGSLFV